MHLEKPETLHSQKAKFIQCYKAELQRKPKSKSLLDDHKRCNRELEFSTIQLNQQPLSWVRSRGQKGEEEEVQRRSKWEMEKEMEKERERVKIKQSDKRGVSQRCIHSSKVTDPHPRLLLRAKCSMEKPDELMSWGRSAMEDSERERRKEEEPLHPHPTPHCNYYNYLKRISQHAVSSPQCTVRRHKQLISQQNWGFSNTMS